MKKSSGLVAGIAVAALVGGCATKPSIPASGMAPPPSADGLRVTLVWDVPVDLDLYVTDPKMETVYYANKRSASGGVLERDAGCKTDPRREVTTWKAALPGRYRVSLDFPDRCGRDDGEVGYRLLVDVGGRRQETTGTLRLARFVYQGFEFDVGESIRETSPAKP